MSLGLHTWEGHGRQQSLLFPWTLDGAYGLLKKSLAESFHSSGNEQFRFQREDSNPAREAKSGTPVTGKDHQEVLHCWTLSLLPVPPDQCSFQPPITISIAIHNQDLFSRLWREFIRKDTQLPSFSHRCRASRENNGKQCLILLGGKGKYIHCVV